MKYGIWLDEWFRNYIQQSSKRTIPIPRQLLPLLKEHKKKSNSQYVVSSDRHQITVRVCALFF